MNNRYVRDSLLNLRHNIEFLDTKFKSWKRAIKLRRAYISQRGKCAYCSKLCYVDPTEHRSGKSPANLATYEHVVALAIGGTNRSSNMVMSCGGCNDLKGCLPEAEFIELRKTSIKAVKEAKRNLEIKLMASKSPK